MPDRAQDTEAIRAVLGWAAEPGGNAQAALARLVARLEAAEQALRYIAGYDVAGYDAHLRSEDVARAALAAAAPGETTSPSAPVAPRGWAGGRKADARHKTQEIGASPAPGETEQTP